MCKMVKRGVVGAAAIALVAGLLLGGKAWYYAKYAYNSARNSVQSNVPIEAEIDAARQQVEALEPAIHQNIETLARAQVDVEQLNREIVATRDNLAREGKVIVALRDSLTTGRYQLTDGGPTYTAEEISADLGRRLDSYKLSRQVLKEKEDTLKLRQQAVKAAQDQLATMAAQKRALTTRIEGIEARLAQLHAAQAQNEFTFDDSSLSQAKKSVSELERRLDIMAKIDEQEGRYATRSVTVDVTPTRNVIDEVNAEFGPATGGTPKDKDL